MKNNQVYATCITDKILQDKTVAKEQKQNVVKVRTVKNEYECGQIIITPMHDVKNCVVEISELVNQSGNLFNRENIEIFYQKYIEVTVLSDKETNGQLGWYPDKLLPYSVAVDLKENYIKANDNQGIILVFNTTEKQSCGIYEGKATIVLDDTKYEMPIEIEVVDITLPKVPTVDSIFCMEYEFVERGEKDDSEKMRQSYIEELLKYKQIPRLFITEKESAEDFANSIRKYYDRITGFCIPMDKADFWGAPRCMDYEYLKSNILSLAKASIEDGVNYFVKARNYFETVDEPLQNKMGNSATITCQKYRDTLRSVAKEVLAFNVEKSKQQLKKEIAHTISEKVYGLITSHYSDEIKGVDIWCPPYKHFANVEENAHYEKGKKWGYTCNAQNYPLPNYHIDDMNSFLSSRVLGYIMKEYGVSGNLYYETVLFEKISYENGLHLESIDTYNNAMHYPGTNGDGFLFYPGIKYGIKGPVASNRLLYIRDAVEEYDLITVLEEICKGKGVSYENKLKEFYSRLHQDTKVTISGKEFFEIRNDIINYILEIKNR